MEERAQFLKPFPAIFEYLLAVSNTENQSSSLSSSSSSEYTPRASVFSENNNNQEVAVVSLPPAKPLNLLPETIDLRYENMTVLDQGKSNCCSATAVAAGVGVLTKGQLQVSRLYLYYMARQKKTGVDKLIEDNGVWASDTLEAGELFGVCREILWPFLLEMINHRPSSECDEEAKSYRLSGVFRIHEHDPRVLIQKLCSTLAAGIPILVAISIHKSFMSTNKTGIVTMPTCLQYFDPLDAQDPLIGAHELLVVGYNLTTKLFICVNSWGPLFGDQGVVYLSFAYVQNPFLAIDFRGFRSVSGVLVPPSTATSTASSPCLLQGEQGVLGQKEQQPPTKTDVYPTGHSKVAESLVKDPTLGTDSGVI
jgi:C1A family cysteine protease